MKYSKNIITVLIVVLMLALLGVLINRFVLPGGMVNTIDEEKIEEQSILISQKQEKRVSKWLTYWDLENGISTLKQNNTDISFFAAYFTETGEVFIPDNLANSIGILMKEKEERGVKYYLTVVNDQVSQDGLANLKSIELISNLIGEASNRKKHIKQLLELVEENDLDGIEIDYEGLTKAPELTGSYLTFISELYEEASRREIIVRVVIEYSMLKDEQYQFIEGPDYIIMCYNLFGPSSEPGPKADYEFLMNIVELMKRIPGEPIYALANGGFEWGKEVRSLTTKEAKNLAKEKKVVENRQQESDCMYYSYKDEKNKERYVWYSDEETIVKWIEFIKEQGDGNIAIWRLE